MLDLTQDVNNFIADFEDREIDVEAIKNYLDKLVVPEELYNKLVKAISSDGQVLDSASSTLNRIRRAIKANENEIKNKMNSFIKGNNSKYLSEQIITIRDGRYVVPVKQAYKNKFGGVIHDQSASGQTIFVEPESVLSINNRQQNLRAEEKQEIRNILKE